MNDQQQTPQLVRRLSLTAAMMIVAGSMIGSGIFRKPATMAGQLLSPELLLLVWVVAGLITFIGALTNAEIAGMFDSTGGQYVYFKHMYGEFTGYLYGWATLAVIQTGSQAAIAYAFAEYLGYFFRYPETSEALKQFSVYIPLVGSLHPFDALSTKLVAIVCILFLSGINYIGVFFGGVVQTIITFIKIGSILLLSLFIFIFGNGTLANTYHGFVIAESVKANLLPLIGLAISGAFWAYDGWNNVTYVAGEVKNPQRNVPLALLFGTLIVIGVYVLINIAFLYVLPIEEMKNSPLVAASAAEKILGPNGASVIALAVIISTFGALNGSILATARVQFAMAKEKLFFSSVAKVHPKYATPHISLLVQGIWSAFLVLSGSFDTITDYVMFAAWLFYMMGAFGVFVLRRKMPDTPRRYRVWGYPVVPAVFVIFSFLFLVNSVLSNTQNAMMGVILIALGIPFYIYWKYSGKKESAPAQP
jgi:basic amino acid/polyamine antiporter, APA family